MKNRIVRSTLAAVFAAGLFVGLAFAYEAPPCSMANSAGKWSFTDNGTVIGVGPKTAVGVFTLDGKGNLLNGAATSSLNGSVADHRSGQTIPVTFTKASNYLLLPGESSIRRLWWGKDFFSSREPIRS